MKGYYIKSRSIEDSEIAHAPPHVREIWDYLLRTANHSDKKVAGIVVKRGQTIRSYRDIQEDLHWMVGWRKETYKKWHCEISMKWLMNRQMVTTTKTTRGMLITICNYDHYQDQKNYENDSESHKKATRKPQSTDTINKHKKKENIKELSKNEFLSAFENFRKAYPGKKRGLETEFKNFQKHKDWKLTIDCLFENLGAQISDRKIRKQRGQFVPQWKNLQTWINQRCWEEESGADAHLDPEPWMTDIEVYKDELRAALLKMWADEDFIRAQSNMNPGVDVKKSLEKACVNYWATKTGWEKKKSYGVRDIDWPTTLANSISFPSNQVKI